MVTMISAHAATVRAGTRGLRRRARPSQVGTPADVARRIAGARKGCARTPASVFSIARRSAPPTFRHYFATLCCGRWAAAAPRPRLSPDEPRYQLLLFVPRAAAEKRDAIVAVWDFCRAVDDAADDAASSDPARAAEEVRSWRRELAASFEGGQPTTSQGLALVPLTKRFNLPREAFEALIDGVEMDVSRDSTRRSTTCTSTASGCFCRRPDLPRDLRLSRADGEASTPPISVWPSSSRTSSATFLEISRAGVSTSRRKTCARSVAVEQDLRRETDRRVASARPP